MSPTDPAVAATKTLLSADEYWEFCQRPENQDRRTELIRGEVVEVPRPTRLHGTVVTRVADHLGRWIERTGAVGYVTADAGLVLEDSPGTVVGPDLAYYTDAATFEDVPPKWGEVPPVLAVEVLSPNDKMSRVNGNIRDYLRTGVRTVWLVDYEERKVTVYRPDRTMDVLDAGAELAGGDELPGFASRVAEFFTLPGGKPLPPPAKQA